MRQEAFSRVSEVLLQNKLPARSAKITLDLSSNFEYVLQLKVSKLTTMIHPAYQCTDGFRTSWYMTANWKLVGVSGGVEKEKPYAPFSLLVFINLIMSKTFCNSKLNEW